MYRKQKLIAYPFLLYYFPIIVCIILIFLLTLISLYVYQKSVAEHTPNTKPYELIYRHELWTKYNNVSQGIQILYPSNWTISQNVSSVTFSPKSKANIEGLPISSLFIGTSPSLTRHLREYVSDSINFYKQNFTNFKVIGSSIASFIDNNTKNSKYKILFRYTVPKFNKTGEGMGIFLIKRDIAYTILFNSTSEKYDSYLPTIEKND